MTIAILFPEEGSCVESSTYLGERGISYVLSQMRQPDPGRHCLLYELRRKKLKRPRLKQIPHLRRSPPQRKLPSQPAAKSRRKRRPFSSFPCSHFCLSPWLLPTAACSKATLPQKRKSVSSAAGTEYFWKMETIPSAQKNLGGFTCTVEKGGAATISFSERSISDLSFYLTPSRENKSCE